MTAALSAAAVAVLCCLAQPACAFERPHAVSLRGEWQLAPARPLIEPVHGSSVATEPASAVPSISDLIPAACIANPNSFVPLPADFSAVNVPLAWEHSLGTDYNGAGWYIRELSVPREWLAEGRRVWLEFDSVSCAAGVWLSGQWCGGHVGDNTRWRVELTDALRSHAVLDAAEDVGPQAAELLIYVEELPGHFSEDLGGLTDPQHGGIWKDLRMYDDSAEPHPVANRVTTLLVMEEGRSELEPLLAHWHSLRFASSGELGQVHLSPTWQPLVVLSTELGPEHIEYMNDGGVIILLCAADGALPGCQTLEETDAYLLVPYIGPLEHSRQIDDHWLRERVSGDATGLGRAVIPVDALGIADYVDPLLRVYATHDQRETVIHDQLFATRVGKGMLMVSSLDHSTDAGQILLGELADFCDRWLYEGQKRSLSLLWEYPATEMTVEMALELAE